MKTRSLLAYLPGMPLKPESLMPRRELAAMAGALLAHGHDTRVIDYGTVWAVRRFASSGMGAAARQADGFQGVGGRSILGGLLPRKPLSHALEDLIQESVRRRRREMTAELQCAGPVDFMVFLADDAADFREVLAVCRVLREHNPEIRMALAGRHARDYGGIILGETDLFDALFEGDEEVGVAEWAARMACKDAWGTVPGLLYLDEGILRRGTRSLPANMDEFPLPCYDTSVYPAVHGDGKFLLFTLEQSRGGGHAGHADGGAARTGRAYRVKSPGALCAEAAQVMKQFSSHAFHIHGGGGSAGQLAALAQEFSSRRCRLQYSHSGEIRHAEPAAAGALAASGLRTVFLPIDTGSQRLLEDFYGRDFGVTEMERALCAYRKAGVFVVAGCTFPCPMDDYHTRAETLRLLIRCRPGGVRVMLPELKPGSVWMQRAPDFGYRVNHAAFSAWARGENTPYLPGEMDQYSLPYRMQGWSRGRMAVEYADLTRDVAELGIALGGSAQSYLMARVAGHEGDEGAFSTRLQQALDMLDAAGLARLVNGFNERACAATGLTAFRPFAPALAAVGN